MHSGVSINLKLAVHTINATRSTQCFSLNSCLSSTDLSVLNISVPSS